eukprot:14262154-Heterocapsa_arctica.AAC.1
MRRLICGSRGCTPPKRGDVEGLEAGEGVSGRRGARSMGNGDGSCARGSEQLGWVCRGRRRVARLPGQLERRL